MKKAAIAITACILSLALAEVLLRFLGIGPAHEIEYQYEVRIRPNHFFAPDSLLGWQSAAGTFSFTYNDTIPLFTCTILPNHQRITSLQNLPDSLPPIHLYGCSFTFGYSVKDNETVAWELQELLPEYRIENKATPGFGLAQAYLALTQAIAAGDTPAIAVFNYASFHNMRSPLHKAWSSALRFAIEQSRQKNYEGFVYPYFADTINTLQSIAYMPYHQLPKDWHWRDKSALINLLNTLYETWHDKRIDATLEQQNHQALLDIGQYCRQHNIEIVFGFLDENNAALHAQKELQQKDFATINYHVDVSDTTYNCSPWDPTHPNPKAHRIYAKKIASEINSTAHE